MRKNRRLARTIMVVGLAIATMTFGYAVASAFLFTQTVPGVAEAGLSEGTCGSSLSATPALLPSGGGSEVMFCSGAGSEYAFLVDGPSFTFTPTFALPSGATDIYAIPAPTPPSAPSGGCVSVSGGFGLSNGTSVTFPGTGTYDYCVDATAGFGSFTVNWAQP
jgi:hypothetical protein